MIFGPPPRPPLLSILDMGVINKWSCTKLIGGGGAGGEVEKSFSTNIPNFLCPFYDFSVL